MVPAFTYIMFLYSLSHSTFRLIKMHTIIIETPKKLKTELHTHFMEVLNGEDFLEIVLAYIEKIGFDINGNICRAFPFMVEDLRYLDYNAAFTWKKTEDVLKNKADVLITAGKNAGFIFAYFSIGRKCCVVAIKSCAFFGVCSF